MTDSTIHRQAEIPPTLSGQRADKIAATLFAEFSRARLQEWMTSGELQVDGATVRAKDKLRSGQHLVIAAKPIESERWEAQELPLNVVFEDEAILVIDKPVGVVVHPAAGNPDGTLLNALLHHAPQLNQIPRAGIVHRIDKDTSGLLVVAKTLQAQTHLVRQLQKHKMHREYLAICEGVITAGGTVNQPIDRHPVQRTRMAVVRGGKEAITHYRVIRRFEHFTYLRVNLETGRTHQIRVHMAFLRHPLVGDSVYRGRLKIPAGSSAELSETLTQFQRQALHAARLSLIHPMTGLECQFESPIPEDFQHLLNVLMKEGNSRG